MAHAYTPGLRGAAWLKIKRSVTLDLVIIAADWGYGRRHGWLSNYHLAARDEETGRLEPVGKTFKGLSDEEFAAMTARLEALRVREEGSTVFVEPRVVVEVAFSDLQQSPTYASGLALRFARITRQDDRFRAVIAEHTQTRAWGWSLLALPLGLISQPLSLAIAARVDPLTEHRSLLTIEVRQLYDQPYMVEANRKPAIAIVTAQEIGR